MQEKETASLDAAVLRHQFEELQERASKDALSGLLNRQTAEAYINRRLQKMSAEDSCALFIVDLDHFKQVNDTLGHQTGDWAIRQAARILSGLFRAHDIVARLGGDEFIVFLSGQITESVVRRKGELICQRLQIALGADSLFNLSASVGIHLARGAAHDFNSLYQSADRALYTAKNNGRRTFCLHMDEDMSGQQSEMLMPVNLIPLTDLLEYMDSGIALVEITDILRIIYASPSFYRLAGIDPQHFTLPKQLNKFVHPDDFVRLAETLREGAKTGRPVVNDHRVSGGAWWHICAVKIDYNSPHPVMLITATDVSAYKENERRLQEGNECLRAAFSQTAQSLWEVDTAAGTISVYDSDGRLIAPELTQSAFPESLIDNGWVHPNSVPRFREFAADLLSGKAQGYGNFIVRYNETGCYRWAAFSYQMLYDESRRAAKAVGVIENLPRSFKGAAVHSVRKQPFPEALTPDLIIGLCANLSSDEIRDLWLEGRSLSSCTSAESFTQLLRKERDRVFSADDRETLQMLFDRDSLLQAYADGRRWLSAEYRRTDGSGSIRWVCLTANLTEDPLTHEIYIFAYLSQADRRHHWEAALESRAVHDPDTGLYDGATVYAMAEAALRGRRRDTCAMALIRLCGLSKLQGADGAGMARERRCIAMAMSVALGVNCILGQYSTDELLVFYPDIRSREDLRRQLENAFSFVRLALVDTVRLAPVRFIAGVVYGGKADTSCSETASLAAEVCTLWQNAAVDTVAFLHEDDSDELRAFQSSAQGDQIRVNDEETRRPLSEQEKDVAYNCITIMLDADSLEVSINGVLHCVRAYYHADRVYILHLSADQQAVTMSYEWTGMHKRSIQHTVTSMPISRFPLLGRCMEERAPVFLTRETKNMLWLGKTNDKTWHFIALPMIRDKRIDGFLCIENPREHSADAALLNTLLPYMLREKNRFRENRLPQKKSSSARLLKLPNLRAYTDTIHSLTSDRYSSLGAVCLDIPTWSRLNSSLGFEYGDRLLCYVSETLGDIFGRRLLFRTWDTEFVVLSPNTTSQVFEVRCSRLLTRLERRYPKDIRIGHTWANGIFEGKRLVDEARTIMRCEHVEAPLRGSGNYPSVQAAARDGRFTVYYQPKINIETGELLGAEALVRGVDEAGKIVPPAQFIEILEQSGAIRDLDLFVLDHTLAQMDRWQKQGLAMFPVSVNFSRITLFSSTAAASILAIQSRYPALPPGLLEVEITETAGNAEKATLNRIMEQLHEFGIRFGLDDFGSQYANLSAFANVKFDTIKLDRSLVAELSGNEINQMLVQDIVRICRKQGMLCVAEGVETEAQRNALRKAGCICAQGYYYDRPLSAQQFARKYLQGEKRAHTLHTEGGKPHECS